MGQTSAMTTQLELVAPGAHRVDALAIRNAISVLLLDGGDGWTLVDTGVGSSGARIRSALTALGAAPGDLRRVLLTHHHSDHVGGLADVLSWAPNAEVMAPAHEADILAGKRPPDPSSNALFNSVRSRAKPPRGPVHRVLDEGDLVAGFRVISTPGHSLGHVSLLRDEDGLLFTADAFGCMLKLRVGVRKALCSDPALARRSAEKLLEEDFASVVFSHGAPIKEGGKERLRHAVASCSY